MPELYFDIKFRLDKASESTIAERLNQVKAQADQATQGSTEGAQKATKATQAQSNAQKELNQKFQRLLTLNEVRFRQDKISQENALKNANLIEKAAISQDILTDNTLQGVRAQKTMQLSQQRIQTGFTGMASTSARANQSLVNLGRIVQDLPFGFLGISNNIDPALTSFRQLKDESGGTMGALKALLTSLKGSGGLIFALGSLLPTAVLIAQRGWNMYSKKTDEAKDATERMRDVVKSFIDESSGLRSQDSFLDIENLQQEVEAIQRLEVATSKIVDAQQKRGEVLNSLLGVSATFNVSQGEAIAATNEYEQTLKVLETRFGLTSEDVGILEDRLEQLEGQLRRNKAIASLDTFAQFRDALRRTTEEFTFLSEEGLIQEAQMEDLRQGYRDARAELRPLIATNEEARRKYIEYGKVLEDIEENTDDVNEATKDLGETYSFRIAELDFIIKRQEILNDRLKEESELRRQQQESARESFIDQRRLLENLPEDEEEDFSAEDRWLEKYKETQEEATRIAQEEAEERRRIQQQLIDTGIGMFGSYISALSDLNQAQTDETEQQARKKFEAQKKLAKAQVIVDSAAAAVRQYRDLPLPAAIAATAAIAGFTAIQLRAIERTQFESAGGSTGGTPSQPEEDQPRGFFITDSGEGPLPLNNQQNNNIVINVENRLDREGLALHVKDGNERISARNFTVISNG